LSTYPLSIIDAKDSVHAVFRERVAVVDSVTAIRAVRRVTDFGRGGGHGYGGWGGPVEMVAWRFALGLGGG
jgi:hypothetical protein